MARDYYGLLGVSPHASETDIKRAYRKLARQYHPDVNPDEDAQAKFKDITAAYEVLSDPEKRRMVDMGVDPLASGGRPGPGDFPNFGGISDVFEAFFGAAGASRRPAGRVRQGADALVSVQLTLEECATGITKQVMIDTAVLCDQCQGRGTCGDSQPVRCSTCGGAGEIQTVQNSLLGQVMTSRICPTCHGDGEVIPDPCPACHGEGRVRSRREVSVKLPAGVGDGMRIRLSAQGEVGPGGGPAGDLYVEVHEQPHPFFLRDGDDLHCTITVPMVDAALGTTMTLDSLLDGSMNVEIPSGTQPGSIISLPDHGIPKLRSNTRGALHLHVDVLIPTKLSTEETDLLEQFRTHRHHDQPQISSPTTQRSHSTHGGHKFFHRLRETFTGR